MDYSHLTDRLPNLVNNLSAFFAPILRAGMYLAYLLVFAIPCWYILKFLKFSKISGPTQLDGIIWILCVGFGFGTLANVAVHCCESYRHAFPFMPLIVIIMVHAGYRLVGAILQKWHREAV